MNDTSDKSKLTNFHVDLSAATQTVQFLNVNNWNQFQHYGKRNPPWIKLHRALLDNYAFCAFSDSSKGHLLLLWLLASQNDGKVPADLRFLERKLSCTGIDLNLFVESGFLVDPQGTSVNLAGGLAYGQHIKC